MKVVHKPAETKVVEVKPATYDLIGLSLEQMAVLTLLTGNSGGQVGSCGLYDNVCKVFEQDSKAYNLAFTIKPAMEIYSRDIAALVTLVK